MYKYIYHIHVGKNYVEREREREKERERERGGGEKVFQTMIFTKLQIYTCLFQNRKKRGEIVSCILITINAFLWAIFFSWSYLIVNINHCCVITAKR